MLYICNVIFFIVLDLRLTDFFHSIRFKVNKVRGQGVVPFFYYNTADFDNASL